MGFWDNVGGAFSKLFLQRYKETLTDYWNNKWPLSNIQYNARSEGLIDVRKVFNITAEGEVILKKVVDEICKDIENDDNKIIAIAKYVNNRLTYKSDKSIFNKAEYWDDPYSIWKRKTDDCDGFTVLILALAKLADIPAYRIKLTAGDVDGGGHAYSLYLSEKNNDWFTIEGSYYANEAFSRFNNDISHRNAKRYGKIWFTTNWENSWAQHDLVIKI